MADDTTQPTDNSGAGTDEQESAQEASLEDALSGALMAFAAVFLGAMQGMTDLTNVQLAMTDNGVTVTSGDFTADISADDISGMVSELFPVILKELAPDAQPEQDGETE